MEGDDTSPPSLHKAQCPTRPSSGLLRTPQGLHPIIELILLRDSRSWRVGGFPSWEPSLILRDLASHMYSQHCGRPNKHCFSQADILQTQTHPLQCCSLLSKPGPQLSSPGGGGGERVSQFLMKSSQSSRIPFLEKPGRQTEAHLLHGRAGKDQREGLLRWVRQAIQDGWEAAAEALEPWGVWGPGTQLTPSRPRAPSVRAKPRWSLWKLSGQHGAWVVVEACRTGARVDTQCQALLLPLLLSRWPPSSQHVT